MRSHPFLRCALCALFAIGVVSHTSAHASVILTTFATPPAPLSGFGTIGFAYAGNKFVGSVQRDGTGVLYSTNLTGGAAAVFAPTVNLISSPASEHFVASSLGLGGFPSRDIYVAAGNTVVHITNDGLSSNTFVTLPNSADQVRGIFFDAVGTFGNEMIITTTTGNIYTVTSAGVATLLASVHEDTEGADVAPIGANFGLFDGQLIVASEGSGTIRAISNTGLVTVVTHVTSAEELTFVPINLGASGNPVEGFYGANYTPNVQKGDVSQFTSFLGDVIVTGESTGIINRIHFNGSSFVVTNEGSFPNQPEDGIFVTAAIVNAGSPIPEPATLAVLGLSLAGLVGGRWLRRSRVA